LVAAEGFARREDLARVAVDEVGGGDPFDAVALRDLGVPRFAVVDLWPGHALFGGDLLDRVLGLFLVQGDAEDLEAVGVVLVVRRHQARHFHHARPAPGGPEVEHDDLALVVGGEVHGLAVHARGLEGRDRRADGVLGREGDFRDLLGGRRQLQRRAGVAGEGHRPRGAADVERLGGVERLAAAGILAVVVAVDEQRGGVGAGGGAELAPGGRVGEQRLVLRAADRDVALVDVIRVVQQGRLERRAVRVILVEAVGAQRHERCVRGTAERELEFAVVHRELVAVREVGLLLFPLRRGVVGEVAVAVGVDVELRVAGVRLVDREEVLPAAEGDLAVEGAGHRRRLLQVRGLVGREVELLRAVPAELGHPLGRDELEREDGRLDGRGACARRFGLRVRSGFRRRGAGHQQGGGDEDQATGGAGCVHGKVL
jgi:hypothetical protein